MSSFKIGDRVVLDTNAAINILDPIDFMDAWQITKDTVCTVLHVTDMTLLLEYQSDIKNRKLIRFEFLKERFKLYKPIVNTPKEAV